VDYNWSLNTSKTLKNKDDAFMRVGNPRLFRCVVTLATLLPLIANAADGGPLSNLPVSQEDFRLKMLVHGAPDFPYIRIFPPLLLAIESGDVVKTGLLLVGGADPNVDFGGQSALHLAVNKGNARIVQLFWRRPGERGAPQRSPLMAAALSHVEIAQMLLDHKADIDAIPPKVKLPDCRHSHATHRHSVS
jgi:ankyrin repeat protein